MSKGAQWAVKMWEQKLADPGRLPRLGRGYSVEYRAAYAVAAVAERKLHALGVRPGDWGRADPRIYWGQGTRGGRDKAFWAQVYMWAVQRKAFEGEPGLWSSDEGSKGGLW